MVAPKNRTQQHTSAEVAALTPEGALNVRKGGAGFQRAGPEKAMNEYQRVVGGGVKSVAVEHVGDLTHRMNEGMSTDVTMDTTMPKINNQLANLSSGYGFDREHGVVRVTSDYSDPPSSFLRALDSHGFAPGWIPSAGETSSFGPSSSNGKRNGGEALRETSPLKTPRQPRKTTQ